MSLFPPFTAKGRMRIGPQQLGRSTPLSFPKRWVQFPCPAASL